ncbi:MAG TPA: NeuD/PglB/VioB family sugar acetyltransferase [Stellaceae bacterium]|nr:NeuD/PglB/VioB family sugar acetyltransferase [Stellaceae bacterium]
MADRVVIFGAGGLGSELLQTIKDAKAAGRDIDCVGFVVDPAFPAPAAVQGIPVSTALAPFAGDPSVSFIVAIGDPAARRRIAAAIESAAGPRFATIVHPGSWVGDTVTMGPGTLVLGLSSITTNIRIGRHVAIGPQVAVANGCVLDDYCTLAPRVALAGHVHLEEGCEVGIGAVVLPRRKVGRWSVIGGGAVVVRPVSPETKVAGVPAREIGARPDDGERGC